MNRGLFKKIILLLILAITLIFAAQNFEAVTIKFLSWSINLPIAVTLLGIYALGGITGGLLFSMLKKVIDMDRKGDSNKDSTNTPYKDSTNTPYKDSTNTPYKDSTNTPYKDSTNTLQRNINTPHKGSTNTPREF